MESKWISVSEQLPQSAGKVLIARRSFDNPDHTEQWEVEMAEWFPKAYGGGESVFWVEDRYGGTDIALTATGLHWMPLPSPPAPRQAQGERRQGKVENLPPLEPRPRHLLVSLARRLPRPSRG